MTTKELESLTLLKNFRREGEFKGEIFLKYSLQDIDYQAIKI